MEEIPAKKKLQLIDKALNYLYDIDSDTLIANYRKKIQGNPGGEQSAATVVMDKETALGLLNEIPDKCYHNKSLKIEPAMLGAISEAELTGLCEEQVTSHPDIEMEIRSMFKFCINIKGQIENDD